MIIFKIKCSKLLKKYKIILEICIFCFHYPHISLSRGSNWLFLFRSFPKKTSVFTAFIVRRFKKNERSLHKRAAQKKRAFWQHVPSPSWKKTSVWEHKADLWCGPKRYFFQKKKSLFFRENFFHTVNALVSKKMSKKAVMLVFLGPKRSWEFFWVFRKKSEKSHFLRFFRKNAYGLVSILIKYPVIFTHAKNRKKCPEKNVKKKGFSFFETFF